MEPDSKNKMMNRSESGDQHQVQAAAGRAVGGDSLLSAAAAATAATASATAPSLHPPPPSASDAAVQPRATDSGSPDDPPQWTETRSAGGRDSGKEEDYSRFLNRLAAPPDGHIDAALPSLTCYARGGIGADPPVPSAQINDSRSTVRHIATDIDGPPPAPASDAAAAAPSTQERIAAASIENIHQGNGDNDGQIASTHDEMTAVIEDLMNAPLNVNEVPLPQPPALIAARYDQMDEDIKALRAISPNVSEVPRPMARIAEDLSNMDEVIKQNVKNASSSGSGMDPPLPQSQMAAFAEEMVEDDGEKKNPAPTTEANDDTPSASLFDVPPTVEEEETLQQEQDPPTPAVARAPSPPPTDQGRSPSNPRGQQQLPIRPPPPSMMPSPDEDADPPVPTLPRAPSMHMVEATLVEEQSEIPVYDAIQVPEQTRLEKNKKIIIALGMGLLAGAAVAAGVAVSAIKSTSDSNTIVPEEVVLSTARPSESSPPSEIPSLQSTTHPSESSSPSDVPSLRPTLGPSRSLAPSTSLRPTSSLRPSRTSSLRPSSMPTATPPVYCGEINILTDEYPEETSWNLVRLDTIDGTTYTEIVLEGSPKEEGHHTYEACLETGDYEFAIFDSYGDGIESPGSYSVAFDGVVFAQGGEFGREKRVSFSLPLPSPPPSESSSPIELPSASFQPSASIVPSQSLRPSFRPSNSFSPSTYWSTLNWSRQGLGFNGDASTDIFGLAVAFSGDASTMAIGAPGYRAIGDRPGYVKVYSREGEGSSWEQRGDTIRGEANGDLFGWSLSLCEDGTTLSIGAPEHDSIGPDSGQVKVYAWDEAALNYVQIGDTLYGAASGKRFGWSLDISNGKILAVGADDSDANGFDGIDSGQVKIYAWDDASSNFKHRGGAINGDAAGDSFGYSVSLSGNGQKLVVGARRNDSNGINAGKVRVFEWDQATSNYEQLGDSLLGDAAGDAFGWSVSFSRDGTALAIGAPYNDKNGQWSGQVKVFAWDEAASTFKQIGRSLYGKAARDSFGWSVALSSEGKTLVVGAPQYFGQGYVEVYGWDEAASEYKRLGQSLGGEAYGDWFGYALALARNGTDLTIGSPYNSRNGTDSGRVEVFHIEL